MNERRIQVQRVVLETSLKSFQQMPEIPQERSMRWPVKMRRREERYGDKAGYHYSEAEDGGIFWSNDPEIPIGRVIRDMGLETVDEVLERNLTLQDALRGGPPSVKYRSSGNYSDS